MAGPADVEVREVGPRDGLQGRPGPSVPVPLRVALVRRLVAAGVTRVEAGSFVSERAVPQMAGTDAVLEATADLRGFVEVLVVNERGARAAVEAPCAGVLAVVAATDAFSARNVRSTRAEALAAARAIAGVAKGARRRCTANVAVAFGCPDDGRVPIAQVVDVAEALFEMGFEQVYLSDTIGVADPCTVRSLVSAVADAVPIERVGLHLHDTRGLAVANTYAALELGVRRFDASIGGIGGCPFAPGATGNVATEDLVHLFDRMGLTSGIDLDPLVETARWLERSLDEELPGHVMHAGRWRGATA